jgi:hypothetical protein
LPGITAAQMASTLEKAGLLIVTEGDELAPARDIGRIGVYEILEIARNQRSGHFTARNVPVPPVDRLIGTLDEARRNRCSDLTLRSLVEEAPRPTLALATGKFQ